MLLVVVDDSENDSLGCAQSVYSFIFMAYRVDFWYWEAIEVCLDGWACIHVKLRGAQAAN